MLFIFGLVLLGLVVAVLNTKKKSLGSLLPNYDPILETKVPVRDLNREAYVNANYFLTPRRRVQTQQAEFFPRKPFEVQNPV
jgi:hypothetical protein